MEPGGGVDEQVEDDDQDGAGDGGLGFLLAPPFRQAAVTFAQDADPGCCEVAICLLTWSR